MNSPCPYVCNNKTEYGYCKTTGCINPKYDGRGGRMTEVKSLYDIGFEHGYAKAKEEAEPIKHGRWEHYKTETLCDDIMGGEYRFKFFRCSECRFDVGGNSGFHYCPNCGAKMDKEE